MSALDVPAAEQWGSRYLAPHWQRLLLLSPLVLLAILSFIALLRSLRRETTYAPFLWSAALFLLGYVGLLIGIWPYLVPYSVTFRDAAAAPSAQAFLLAGTFFLLPLTLGFAFYVYWTHRGKVKQTHGYH